MDEPNPISTAKVDASSVARVVRFAKRALANPWVRKALAVLIGFLITCSCTYWPPALRPLCEALAHLGD